MLIVFDYDLTLADTRPGESFRGECCPIDWCNLDRAAARIPELDANAGGLSENSNPHIMIENESESQQCSLEWWHFPRAEGGPAGGQRRPSSPARRRASHHI